MSGDGSYAPRSPDLSLFESEDLSSNFLPPPPPQPQVASYKLDSYSPYQTSSSYLPNSSAELLSQQPHYPPPPPNSHSIVHPQPQPPVSPYRQYPPHHQPYYPTPQQQPHHTYQSHNSQPNYTSQPPPSRYGDPYSAPQRPLSSSSRHEPLSPQSSKPASAPSHSRNASAEMPPRRAAAPPATTTTTTMMEEAEAAAASAAPLIPTIGGESHEEIEPSPVRTRFPTARIKRIMQADEEVGKVAQQTPIAVGKALELFMVTLVRKSADIAREKGSKRVSAAMLKQAIEVTEELDFLKDTVAAVEEDKPGRAGGAKAKNESESDDEESEPKKKTRGRKKKV